LSQLHEENKNVLLGLTQGYKNHPQFKRFKDREHAGDAINQYFAKAFGFKIHDDFFKI